MIDRSLLALRSSMPAKIRISNQVTDDISWYIPVTVDVHEVEANHSHSLSNGAE